MSDPSKTKSKDPEVEDPYRPFDSVQDMFDRVSYVGGPELPEGEIPPDPGSDDDE